MAIAYQASISQTGNSTTPTVGRNNNSVGSAGRVCIALVFCVPTITAAPSGWNLIDSVQLNDSSWVLAAYWRVHLGSSEPATFQWTSTTGRWIVFNVEFSGVDATTPVDVSSKNASASSTSVTALGVDPTYLEDMLLFLGGAKSNTATWTAPSGFTEPPSTGGNERLAAASIGADVSYLLLSDGDPTGDKVATLSGAALNAAMLIALKDASATPDAGADHDIAYAPTWSFGMGMTLTTDPFVPPVPEATNATIGRDLKAVTRDGRLVVGRGVRIP